jgi:glyceraldehyde 3-phosphate dehydrogenase
MNLKIPAGQAEGGAGPDVVRVPLTHVKVFGWYDNEMGSYTYRLGELTIRAARSM